MSDSSAGAIRSVSKKPTSPPSGPCMLSTGGACAAYGISQNYVSLALAFPHYPVQHQTMLSLIDDCRLEIEYDERFAAHKFADDQQDFMLYGDTPSERLKTYNWAQWCERATICARFCRLCGLPMDTAEDTHPDDRCPICAAMETTLFHRPHWENLKVGYSRDDRSRMGLEAK